MIIYRITIDSEKKLYKYVDKDDKIVKDKKILEYIESLVIPPAYRDVEIFYEKSPKILFQGLDANNRLQQIYSKKWRESADKTKFKELIEFGRKLPSMNLEINKNLNSHTPSKEKIIAIILQLIQTCGFRIGQMKYYDLYGSVGLSTLMKKHLKFKKTKNGTELHVKFIGKKKVENECIVTDKTLIREIGKYADSNKHEFLFMYSEVCRETSGKEVNVWKSINAIDINNWLKQYGESFTTKFFRTYSVNITLIDLLRELSKEIKFNSISEAQRKKIIVGIIKDLACSINNTPTICKKSYISPKLIELFIEHPLKFKKEILDNGYNSNITFIKFLEKNYN